MSDPRYEEPIDEPGAPDEGQETRLVCLAIYGLRGPTCAALVRNSLLKVSSVVDAEVQQLLGLEEVIVNTTAIDTGALVQAIAQAGGSHPRN